MKYSNKIDAIKALREASVLTGHLEWNDAVGAYRVVLRDGNGIERPNGMGLREAKDLVEGILELGISQCQQNEKVALGQPPVGTLIRFQYVTNMEEWAQAARRV